ncbi:MAG: ATPase domain-containing protein, partial [Candidatus Korarchaeota archaeon]|nr:ATPase domain-containing protein [Candidatus Korarchaeota archaeon]
VSAAKMGRRSLIVSFETSKGTVVKLARSFGMTEEDEVQVASVVPQALGPVEQFELIEELVDENQSEFVLVDSLTAIEHAVGREGLIDFTRYLQWMAKERGMTILCTQLGSGHFEKDTRAASLYADTVILLRVTERDGVLLREASVLKSRRLGIQGVRYLMELSEGRIRFLRER